MLASDEDRLVDVLTWAVIPALPGTRVEWKAEWCAEGSVAVHAWLVRIDVMTTRELPRDDDLSCCKGFPMILNARGVLQEAHYADLDGEPGDLLEP